MPKVTLEITELHEILARDYGLTKPRGLGRQRDQSKEGARSAACKQALDFDGRGVGGKQPTDPSMYRSTDLAIYHRSTDLAIHLSIDLQVLLGIYRSIDLQIHRSSDLQI